MITIIIAIAGLVLAIVSLTWNILLHFLSLPRIKVRASISSIHPTPLGLRDGDEVLVVTAVNERSRQVTITGFYGVTGEPEKKSHFFINGSSSELQLWASAIPITLNEGEAARLLLVFRNTPFHKTAKGPKYFYVGDTCGRNWYSRRWPLRKQLRKDRDKLPPLPTQ